MGAPRFSVVKHGSSVCHPDPERSRGGRTCFCMQRCEASRQGTTGCPRFALGHDFSRADPWLAARRASSVLAVGVSPRCAFGKCAGMPLHCLAHET